MNKNDLRSILVKAMLGCLVVAALVAVAAILIGTFDEVAWRALGTVFAASIHIGVLLVVLSMTVSESKNVLVIKSTNFAINSTLVISILSFFTSVLTIWTVLDGEIGIKLYATYAILLFVVLHSKTLIDIQAVHKKVIPYAYANYATIFLVAAMLAGAVWTEFDIVEGFYGRLLAASVIVDVTLSIIIAVMHRLYIQQNPSLTKENAHAAYGVGRLIIALILFFFVVYPIASMLFYVS